MNTDVFIKIAAAMIILVVFFWLLKGILSGAFYYRKHPGAKLLDDMARTNTFRPQDMQAVIERVGAAKDPRATVDQIRKEKNLKQ